MSNSMHVPYCGFHLGVALWILYSGKTCLCVVMCISVYICMVSVYMCYSVFLCACVYLPVCDKNLPTEGLDHSSMQFPSLTPPTNPLQCTLDVSISVPLCVSVCV